MKKLLLSAAVATALLPASVLASDAAKFYGRLNVSLQSVEVDAAGGDSVVSDLVSHASRLGVEGKSVMPEGYSVFYKAEYELNPLDETKKSAPFKQRNIYVGLKGSMGSLSAGYMDTPVKKAQAKVDLFSDVVDMKAQLNGENRAEQLSYQSPGMAGVKFSLSSVVGGERDNDHNWHDSFSTSVTYKREGIYAAVAYDSDVNNADVLRLVGQYTISDLTLGALWQQAENADGTGDAEDGFLISGAYKLGANKLKAQYIASDIKSEGADTYTLGLDHKLGKSTKLFAYASYTEDKAEDRKTITGLGMQHKF